MDESENYISQSISYINPAYTTYSPNKEFEALKDIFDNSTEEEIKKLEMTRKANVYAMPALNLLKLPVSCKQINTLEVNGFNEKRAAQDSYRDGSRKLFEALSSR